MCASAIPGKSCLKRPRNAPSTTGSTEPDRPTKKHVTFGVSAEVSIPPEGQSKQKMKKPALLPPILRPEGERGQIELARKRTALCQKLLPVRKNMLKLKKSQTITAEDVDAERLAGMFLTGTSRADNEEDAALLKDAVAKMYREIFVQELARRKHDVAQGSEAIPGHNETAEEIAQLSTMEANTTREAKQSSAKATATSNEGTDFEANSTAEHRQVEVADRRVCRTRNKKKWIIDSRATVGGQLSLQHATSVAQSSKTRTLHRVLCVKSLIPALLSVDMLPAAYGV